MAVSTLSQAGPRPLRRLLVALVVIAVALIVSLVLVVSGGGHTATRHTPVLTHGPASPNISTVNSGPDNPTNQAAQTPDRYQCRLRRAC